MAEGGGDGLPFIGSLMRLISSGEICYQGTLYTIDMPNSTIALSNVRCYGTEGRRKENEVPPSDQVFEYVVFKGSEIKELTVVQPPPPEPAPPPPPVSFQDPAIVSAGPPPPGVGPAAAWGARPSLSQSYGAPPLFSINPWGPLPPGVPGGPPSPPEGPPPAPPPSQPVPAPAPTVAITPMSAANGTVPIQQHRPTSYAHAAGRRAPIVHRSGRGGGQQQRPQQSRPPPMELPKEEFNFEEALKKFNKGALEKEVEEEHVPVAAAQSSYQKDDFFDQLSCDALERVTISEAAAAGGERGDWRTKMHAQRKVDMETFGGMARMGGSYRGRGRGRGGRGYYGGGRGRSRGGQQNNQQQAVA